jgi:hypothetical protein
MSVDDLLAGFGLHGMEVELKVLLLSAGWLGNLGVAYAYVAVRVTVASMG